MNDNHPPKRANALRVWTIYDHPRDYPEGFMARLFMVHPGGYGPRNVAFYGPTLESVRNQLPPGLYNLGRQPEDEPHIVETWI